MSQQIALTCPLASSDASADLEAGQEEEPRWAMWARQAAERVRQGAEEAQRAAAEQLERVKEVDWNEQVSRVQENVSSGLEVVKDRASVVTEQVQDSLSQGVDRVKAVDWDEKTKGLRASVSSGFETVQSSASSAATAVQEKSQTGFEVTREYSRSSVESLGLTESFTQARDSVCAATGAATGVLSNAGESVGGTLSIFTVSPATWAQFAGVFFIGSLFIMLSLNFLPILIIAPHKFAMAFTIGSVTMLSSFIIFSGPQAFFVSFTQRDKQPFNSLYAIGLVGTLFSTLYLRSYIFTAVFAIIQAVSLLYFVASYLPGGKTAVTACFSCCGRSARTVMAV